jgi:multidrug resistance efflux pump
MQLEISRDPANLDRHIWVDAPVTVDLNGQPRPAMATSMAGIMLAPFHGEPEAVGAPVALHLQLPHDGFGVSFDCTGVIESWHPEERRLVVGFVGLRTQEREILAQFLAHYAPKGEAGMPPAENPTDSLVQRLESGQIFRPGQAHRVNVTALRAVSNGTLSNSKGAAGGPPDMVAARNAVQRAGRTLAVGSTYGLLGLAVAGYLSFAAYRHVVWLDVATSTLEAPIETIVSLGDGVVRWSSFKPGDAVKGGDVVLNIYDNVLEREIEQAAIAVREKENKVAYLRRRLDHEQVRMVGLGQVSTQKTAQINAEIEGLKNKLKAAGAERRQLSSATPGPLSQVRQRMVGLKQAITLKELELKGRAAVNDKTDGRMQLVGSNLVGDSDTLEAQQELAEAEVTLAEERHKAYLDQRDRLAVRAPFDGTLRQIARFDQANIKRGDVAAVIEQNGDRAVRAILRQDQALRVAVGALAEVRIPATGVKLQARVASIEPAHWGAMGAREVESTKGQGGARGNADESQTAVRLIFTDPRLLDSNQVYRAGLPVIAMIRTSGAAETWDRTAPARAKLGNALDTSGRWCLDATTRVATVVLDQARNLGTAIASQFGVQMQTWRQRGEERAESGKAG